VKLKLILITSHFAFASLTAQLLIRAINIETKWKRKLDSVVITIILWRMWVKSETHNFWLFLMNFIKADPALVVSLSLSYISYLYYITIISYHYYFSASPTNDKKIDRCYSHSYQFQFDSSISIFVPRENLLWNLFSLLSLTLKRKK
jgi:hypothetical protein